MSSAKFLPFAVLWLGLATYAGLARAAQPVSDYDLEPLLRRYGGDANQTMSSSVDDTSADSTSSDSQHTIADKGDDAPDRSSTITSSAADNDSSQCDQQEPALLHPSTGIRPTPPSPRKTSDWPANYAHRDVKQATASSSTTYSSPMSDDDSTLLPAPNIADTRSVQMSRPLSYTANNARTAYSVNNANGRAGDSQNSAQEMPETIPSGIESPNSAEGLACNTDCDSCFNPCGDPGFYGGADYLFVRPRFSDAQAYDKSVRTTVAPIVFSDTIVQQKFDYQSSVRAFLGYRFDCGDEIHFTYWNYENNGSIQSPLTPGTAASPEVFYGGQFMVRAGNAGSGPNGDGAGDSVLSTYGLMMNVYDIDYSKCCCGCGSCGCNSCGCGST